MVTCGLALLLARIAPTLLVDLAGDAPAALGLPEPEGPGWLDWMAAGPDVPPERLLSLEIDAGPGLHLLPSGGARSGGAGFDAGAHLNTAPETSVPAGLHGSPAARAGVFADALTADSRRAVADCGLLASPGAIAVASAASVGLLVLRPCYLALRRALVLPVRPTGVVLVRERERALTRSDVEDVLGVPVRAQVELDPVVARCVDAGLLARRLPRSLERCLRGAA